MLEHDALERHEKGQPDLDGFSFDLRARPVASISPVPQLNVLGRCSVNGKAVKSTKALEFIVALATSGGSMSKDGVLNRIYERDVCQSAIPTLAYRARKLGIEVDYEAADSRYVLRRPVRIDVLDVLTYAKAGRPRDALCLYGGRCLPGSDSPFADALRATVEGHVVRSVLDSGDEALISLASRMIDNYELAERAMANTDEPFAAVLSSSYYNAAGF